jgi:hypothetical protein
MMRETDATTINEDIVDAASVLKFDSRLLIPPARKQQPRTWVISYVNSKHKCMHILKGCWTECFQAYRIVQFEFHCLEPQHSSPGYLSAACYLETSTRPTQTHN